MNSNLFYSKDKKSILFFVTIEMIYHPCYKPSHPFYRRHTGNMKGPALRRKHGTPILRPYGRMRNHPFARSRRSVTRPGRRHAGPRSRPSGHRECRRYSRCRWTGGWCPGECPGPRAPQGSPGSAWWRPDESPGSWRRPRWPAG